MDERLTNLKRFLDRLLSEPQRDPLQDQANMVAAAELGLVLPDESRVSTPQALIELTRAAIESLAPKRSADQGLEAMSAPAATQPPPSS